MSINVDKFLNSQISENEIRNVPKEESENLKNNIYLLLFHSLQSFIDNNYKTLDNSIIIGNSLNMNISFNVNFLGVDGKSSDTKETKCNNKKPYLTEHMDSTFLHTSTHKIDIHLNVVDNQFNKLQQLNSRFTCLVQPDWFYLHDLQKRIRILKELVATVKIRDDSQSFTIVKKSPKELQKGLNVSTCHELMLLTTTPHSYLNYDSISRILSFTLLQNITGKDLPILPDLRLLKLQLLRYRIQNIISLYPHRLISIDTSIKLYFQIYNGCIEPKEYGETNILGLFNRFYPFITLMRFDKKYINNNDLHLIFLYKSKIHPHPVKWWLQTLIRIVIFNTKDVQYSSNGNIFYSIPLLSENWKCLFSISRVFELSTYLNIFGISDIFSCMYSSMSEVTVYSLVEKYFIINLSELINHLVDALYEYNKFQVELEPPKNSTLGSTVSPGRDFKKCR